VDIATLIGFLGAIASITGAILIGGSALMFVNIPSLFIVVGGTFAVVLMNFPLAMTLSAFKVALKAFLHKPQSPEDIIEQSMNMANIARREGLLGLESVQVDNEFLKRGVQLVVDGSEPDVIRAMLNKDINLTIERHDNGQQIFKTIADVAPAMGMIGTLIGLVQMMSNMEDPKAIGPAMAVALLTTLYGAVIANALALPIANKLALRSKEERLTKSMILEGIASIANGHNPRVMEEIMKTYLPPKNRNKEG
jgi:chemotaxis protein MotA